MEQTTELFQKAIGFSKPWYVERVTFSAEGKRLDIYVEFKRGTKFRYEEKDDTGKIMISGEFGVYDTVQKIWRHLNFFEHECYLHCRVPRLDIGEGKTRIYEPSFAGLSQGFTLLFEALLLQLCKGMTVSEVGRLTKESDHKIWEMLDRYIKGGRDISDFTAVQKVGVDETAIARGHTYITLFVNLVLRTVLFVTEGRSHQTVKKFVKDLEDHQGKTEHITQTSSDLSPAFIKGITESLPDAQITFDKFHVIKLINGAVDRVRREEVKIQPILKEARYVILKNEQNLTDAQQNKLQELQLSKLNLKTVRAMHLRENFQAIYQASTKEQFEILLKKWYFWATHSRIPAMIAVSRTIKAHWDGILNWYDSRINNGVLEGINSLIQAAKSKARGYRSFKNFSNIIYLLKGDLNFSAVNSHYPL
ncbi:MAG: ISL3 family transposase [bacterium]|nr:ISL3 family transposase [bacterium]